MKTPHVPLALSQQSSFVFSTSCPLSRGDLERQASTNKNVSRGLAMDCFGNSPAPQCRANEKSRAWTYVSNLSLPLSMNFDQSVAIMSASHNYCILKPDRSPHDFCMHPQHPQHYFTLITRGARGRPRVVVCWSVCSSVQF